MTTTPIKEGTDVISLDDKHVGDVEKVVVDPETDRATHILISKGLLLKEEKIIPVQWVKSYGQDQITLYVDSNVIQNLPKYMEE